MILVCGATVGLLCSSWLSERARVELDERLGDHARVLLRLFESEAAAGGGPRLQSRVAALGEDLGTRLTLIAAGGTVLADSQKDPVTMDNHGDRPEVLESLRTDRLAYVSRHSGTLNREFRYAALPIARDARVIGFARAAAAVTNLTGRRNELVELIALGVALAMVVASIAGFALSRRMTGSIRRLNRVVEDLMAGKPVDRIHATGGDEIAQMARAFQTLTVRLADRLETITADRNKLRAVLSGMIEGVVAVDAEERILLFNDVAARLFGQDGEAAVGRPVWEVLRWSQLTDALKGCLQTGEAQQFEATMPSSASERTMEVQVTPLRDARDEVSGATLILNDTTRLRRLEEMRRDFVANVSHELKTPLTAIKGLCETLLDDQEMGAGDRQRFLGKISKQTSRLASLVSDLLTLSRLDEERYLARPEPCDWTRIVRESIRDLLPRAKGKGLRMGFDIADQPAVVRAEPEALRQVVDNLVDNAIKYTPGGGAVSVSLRTEDGQAVLRVEDTGIGLAPEDRERVFERFYRVDKARSRELGGTGLGLAIVKNIALNLGGAVGLESAPGQGSAFSISIPLFHPAVGDPTAE